MSIAQRPDSPFWRASAKNPVTGRVDRWSTGEKSKAAADKARLYLKCADRVLRARREYAVTRAKNALGQWRQCGEAHPHGGLQDGVSLSRQIDADGR